VSLAVLTGGGLAEGQTVTDAFRLAGRLRGSGRPTGRLARDATWVAGVPKIIWAHTGFSTSAARVRELLDAHPALWGELSYRGGIIDGSGMLTREWRALFASHSSRFLLGSDTWINERWHGYDTIMKS
jgi:hypothetical protein